MSARSACAVLAAGAAAVTLVNSSAPALEHAEAAAAHNGLSERVVTMRGDAFETMEALAKTGERFDIVVCDPPAFARSRKDADAGLRAYGRMARLAAALVAPGGFLFVASCSHHAPLEAWAGQIAWGLHRARRAARILATTGAGPDHPVHPQSAGERVSEGAVVADCLSLGRTSAMSPLGLSEWGFIRRRSAHRESAKAQAVDRPSPRQW